MWLWILATIVAFYIKGLCGFANTLVFTSILGFGTNNINISPIEVDGYKYHKEDTVQATRDLLKNHIMELYEIPLLRFKTNLVMCTL